MKKSVSAFALTLSVTLGVSSLAPVTVVAQSSSGSSGSSNSRPSQPVTEWPDGISEGLIVTIVGDILGRGISDEAGFLIGDLGIMTNIGDADEFAIVFGDSWRGPGFGQGEWMSPVGVVAVINDEGRIEIVRPLNDGDRVEQLIDYNHTDGLTLIPSDVLNIDGTLYMQGMWNKGIGNVLYTETWRSDDDGATWTSLGRESARHNGGMTNLITWEQGPDGYVYMMSSEFQRRDDVYLTRFRPEDISDSDAWVHYNPADGTWGSTLTPVLADDVSAGEMTLRHIEGHWVLAMFNAATYSIEVRISPEIARDWNEIDPAHVVIGGNWGDAQTPKNFAQLYGAYIVPGSTLDNMDLVISQWNTSNNSRYMSTQFNVQGLDEFFGIGTAPAPRARTMEPQVDRTGDQSVIEVVESGVSPQTRDLLRSEQVAEDASDVAATLD